MYVISVFFYNLVKTTKKETKEILFQANVSVWRRKNYEILGIKLVVWLVSSWHKWNCHPFCSSGDGCTHQMIRFENIQHVFEHVFYFSEIRNRDLRCREQSLLPTTSTVLYRNLSPSVPVGYGTTDLLLMSPYRDIKLIS